MTGWSEGPQVSHKAPLALALELLMALCGHQTAQFSFKDGIIHVEVPAAWMSTPEQVALSTSRQ